MARGSPMQDDAPPPRERSIVLVFILVLIPLWAVATVGLLLAQRHRAAARKLEARAVCARAQELARKSDPRAAQEFARALDLDDTLGEAWAGRGEARLA